MVFNLFGNQWISTELLTYLKKCCMAVTVLFFNNTTKPISLISGRERYIKSIIVRSTHGAYIVIDVHDLTNQTNALIAETNVKSFVQHQSKHRVFKEKIATDLHIQDEVDLSFTDNQIVITMNDIPKHNRKTVIDYLTMISNNDIPTTITIDLTNLSLNEMQSHYDMTVLLQSLNV